MFIYSILEYLRRETFVQIAISVWSAKGCGSSIGRFHLRYLYSYCSSLVWYIYPTFLLHFCLVCLPDIGCCFKGFGEWAISYYSGSSQVFKDRAFSDSKDTDTCSPPLCVCACICCCPWLNWLFKKSLGWILTTSRMVAALRSDPKLYTHCIQHCIYTHTRIQWVFTVLYTFIGLQWHS